MPLPRIIQLLLVQALSFSAFAGLGPACTPTTPQDETETLLEPTPQQESGSLTPAAPAIVVQPQSSSSNSNPVQQDDNAPIQTQPSGPPEPPKTPVPSNPTDPTTIPDPTPVPPEPMPDPVPINDPEPAPDPVPPVPDYDSRELVLELLDVRLSSTTARGGEWLISSCRICSNKPADVRLVCRLNGPNGLLLEDLQNEISVPVIEGDYWYDRYLQVNPPPNRPTGLYDVYWEIQSQGTQLGIENSEYLSVVEGWPIRVPILMYHFFGDQAEFPYRISVDNFRSQMEALKAAGYTTMYMGDLLDCRSGIAPLPAKPVVITIDDGEFSVYTHAYPVLADPAINLKATVFVATGQMGDWNSLTWDQAREMQRSGHFDIQSHSVTHSYLSQMSQDEAFWELVRSRFETESQLGGLTLFLSYPYGDTNPAVKTAAWQAGYLAAVVASGGVDETCVDRFAWKRVSIDSNVTTEYNPQHRERYFMSVIGDPDAPSLR